MRRYPDTIAARVDHEIVIRKSRFLTRAVPVTAVADAESVIAAVRREHWDARHHCTAMVTGVLGDQARSSDDGEPSGTAGMPMLEVVRRRGLTDVVVVVTRWFGGVKLGAGGLVRAYSTAVSECLDRAALVHRRALTQVVVEVSHADAGRADNMLRDWAERHGGRIGESAYGARAALKLWVPEDELARLDADVAAASAGEWAAVRGEERVVDVPA